MTLPRPGASHLDNVCATIILHGNRREWLKLDRIASYQGFDPGEFRARLAQIETAMSLTPSKYEEPEGK